MASNQAVNDRIVWSPYSPPSHPDKAQVAYRYELIYIKHPGSDAPLFTLPPLDAGGFHHETVRIACGILVGNSWDGFFSLDKQGEQPVPTSEKILREETYYFQTARSLEDPNYAVTPTFEHWRFPHGNLPPSWRDIASFQQLSRPDSDTSCRITQFEDAIEDAHLVPHAERQWWINNKMGVYVPSTRVDKLKDPQNIIRLRSDIHTVFDAKNFAIVPIEGRLVVYCMNTALGSQVERLHHGVEVHRIRARSQYLLARFAYTVFAHLRAFLETDTDRKLRLWVENEETIEICGPERCEAFARYTAYRGKSGSASPRKRPHAEAAESCMDSDEDDWSEEEFRGRKRRRRGETQSLSGSEFSGRVGYSADSSLETPQSPPSQTPKSEGEAKAGLELSPEACQPQTLQGGQVLSRCPP